MVVSLYSTLVLLLHSEAAAWVVLPYNSEMKASYKGPMSAWANCPSLGQSSIGLIERDRRGQFYMSSALKARKARRTQNVEG